MDEKKQRKKSVITLAEAYIMAAVSFVSLEAWRGVLKDYTVSIFGEKKLVVALVTTALLWVLFNIFENVDIGTTSLYEIKNVDKS